jgi:hypothetical protein
VWAAPTIYATIGILWALAWLMTLVPLAAIFRCAAGWPSRVMACYTAGMVAAAVAMVACLVIGFQQTRAADAREWGGYARDLFDGLVYAGFGAGLLANGLILARR